VAGYFASASFAAGLAPTTRSTRRRILERFREQHAEKSIVTLGKSHIERMVGAKAATPGAALNFLVSLRALMRHAVTAGLRADDPTTGVRAPKYRSSGFYTWTDEDISKFEARHPIGTRARLAMVLLLYTAQRRADVVKLGRQHMRDGVLTVRQQKTGTTLSIPIHPELRKVLEATPIENMTFLTTHGGKPLSVDGFSGWFRRKCQEAGLPSGAAAPRP
jgi:integrase